MKITAIKVAKLNEEELRGLVNAGERPTLKTIARISGLAVTTVSRAMRDESDIGADTKELVARIAEAIGYVPNRAGLRLRTGRTNVISLVVPAEGDVLNNVAKLTNSIAKELRGTQCKQACCKSYSEIKKTLASINCNDVVITVSIQIGRNHRETYN